MTNPKSDAPRSHRGFAAMDQSKQREIASRRRCKRRMRIKGCAHEFTADEARAAGRKGGETVSRDRDHMARIGRAGGQRRGEEHRQGVRSTTDSQSAAE